MNIIPLTTMMKHLHSLLFLFVPFLISVQPRSFANWLPHPVNGAPDWNLKTEPFPTVKREEIDFQYRSAASNGNVTVKDAYYWLEKPSKSSLEVETFKQDQEKFFQDYLKKSGDFESISKSIKDAAAYGEISFPSIYGDPNNQTYLYGHADVKTSLYAVYITSQLDFDQSATSNFATLPGKKIFDESTLDKDHKLYNYDLSPDLKKLVFVVTPSDYSHSPVIYVKDVEAEFSQNDTKNVDVITDARYDSSGWLSDSSGFFYQHHQEENFIRTNSTIRFHRFGTDSKEDVEVVKSDTDPDRYWTCGTTDDDKYLIAFSNSNWNSQNKVFATSLDQPISSSMKWISISPYANFSLTYVTNVETDFYFTTNQNSSSLNVVRFKPNFNKAKTVTDLSKLSDELDDELVILFDDQDSEFDRFITFDTNKIVIGYTKNAKRQYNVYDLTDGKLLVHLLPDFIGSASSLTSSTFGKDVYLWAWSFNSPETLFHAVWNKGNNSFTTEKIFEAKLKSIDVSQYVVEQKWSTSSDGVTQVPFFLFYRKGLTFDGTHPVMLTFRGAGGFEDLPYYNPTFLSWVHDRDGILCLANPRGGVEKGKAWYAGAKREKKQNTIDDLNAVINDLLAQKIASAGNIIVNVESQATPIALALTNQIPQGILGAVIAWDGLYDLLQIDHTDYSSLLIREYGDPQDPQAFDWLFKLSPYDNVNASKVYPTIILLPDEEDGLPGRAWHSYKMISQLQFELKQNPNPLLLTVPDPSLPYDESRIEKSAQPFAIVDHALGLKRVS